MREESESDPNSKISRDLRCREKRPFLASQCEHLADAEKFRRKNVDKISDGREKIQNAVLGEHAIRDLNNGINKLMREQWHWNRRIKELGGEAGGITTRRNERRCYWPRRRGRPVSTAGRIRSSPWGWG